MSFTAEIDGQAVGIINGSLFIEESVNGRTVCRFRLASDGSYRPSRRDEVFITNDQTMELMFGGVIDTVKEKGLSNEPIPHIELAVDCVDFNIYGDWANVVNGGFPEGWTLEMALTSLVAGFVNYGYAVTLDAGQVTGPTLPQLLYDVRTYTSILNELADITGYVWEIDYDKVLRMYVPGTTPAPFDIVDGINVTMGDIEVSPASRDFANRVIVRFGSGAREIIDHFVGDGSTTAFQINYFPLIAHRGIVGLGGSVVGGVVVPDEFETLSIGGGGEWDYDPTTGIVTRTSPVPNGEDVWFQYTAQFPVAITRPTTPPTPPIIEVVRDYPNVFNHLAAIEIAEQELDRISTQPRTVQYTTREVGLQTGMSQHIEVAIRNLDEDFFITDIEIEHIEEDIVEYHVTALEGTLNQNTWRDVYSEWSELGGGGSGSSAATTVTGGGTPGAPPTAVQFNRSGTFGGHAAFTFNESNRCLIVGEGSSITATDPQDCQIFGSNCHITD